MSTTASTRRQSDRLDHADFATVIEAIQTELIKNSGVAPGGTRTRSRSTDRLRGPTDITVARTVAIRGFVNH